MKTTTLKQGAMIPASPHEVYEMFMDSKKHAAFTGGETRISREIGGSFTVFDGWASGKNVELVPDQKIVQTWRADDWPAGHFSTITIKLLKEPKGTKLLFTQTEIPVAHAKSVAQGWKDYYWQPMKLFLEKLSS